MVVQVAKLCPPGKILKIQKFPAPTSDSNTTSAPTFATYHTDELHTRCFKRTLSEQLPVTAIKGMKAEVQQAAKWNRQVQYM